MAITRECEVLKDEFGSIELNWAGAGFLAEKW